MAAATIAAVDGAVEFPEQAESLLTNAASAALRPLSGQRR